MTCRFCYIPFTGERDTLENQKKYIDKAVSMGAELITFGGGDPFLDKNFRELLQYAARLPVSIQIDTNGLRLKEEDIGLIKDTVDFMSLPLEGSQEIDTLMRGNVTHFDTVIKWLQRLLDEGIKVKINTVVTKQNIDSLPLLAEILQPFATRENNPLLRWSLYEFIPAEAGDINRKEFEISQEQFEQAMNNLQQNFPDLPAEPGSRGNRKSAYFFVRDTGYVYVTDPSPANDNSITIGHILDDDICQKWGNLTEGKKYDTRAELRLRLIN
jgi:MoaA/NifB/PqqE/SkfB family radical SAM enzyme